MDRPAERVPRQPKMVFGFCMSGHHRLCRGLYRRPLNFKGEEQPDAVCSCKCHDDPDWIDPRIESSPDEDKRETFVFKKAKYP